MKGKKIYYCLLVQFLLIIGLNAQNISTPKASQFVSTTQEIGITKITITYHSPGVKGRTVFGGIVPYGQIWRAGANDNTTITISSDAKIGGQEITPGTYGLYILPKDENNCKIILSKYAKSWGTIIPVEEDLVAMFDVQARKIPYEEWLSYNFTDRTDSKIRIALRWEKMEIPFEVEINTTQEVLNNIRAELKGVAGFGWQGHMQAARYCLQNKTNLDEAMTWIDKSIANSKGFSNLSVKAGILAEEGKTQDAYAIMQEALPTGTPGQLNAYGYQLLGMGNTSEAVKIFAYNVEKHPDDPFIWGYTDSLGEAYLKDGNKEKALKYYKIAREKAPANQHAYLDNVIDGIK
jgi:tetratricopeptide (TPR) repeat protein